MPRGGRVIPLSDENPTLRTPVVTSAIVALNVLAWVFVQGAGLDPTILAASVCNLGLIAGEITGLAAVGTGIAITRDLQCLVDSDPINNLTPFTSMFLHGSWGHLLSNSLFFWVFGNNIEDSMGPWRFLAFYLLCGLAAAGAHVLVDPASPIPTVGASGAVSGVLGAYLLLYPRVRVNMLFLFVILIRVIPIPAWVVLLWWFALQVITGLPQLSQGVRPDVSGGIAVWAHIGGFVAGVLLIPIFRNRRLVAERLAESAVRGVPPRWRA
jgi:membrane associated rhomboid family serine protease